MIRTQQAPLSYGKILLDSVVSTERLHPDIKEEGPLDELGNRHPPHKAVACKSVCFCPSLISANKHMTFKYYSFTNSIRCYWAKT